MDANDMLLKLSPRQTVLVRKLVKQHYELLGEKRRKPSRMTFDEVIGEMTDSKEIEHLLGD